MEWISEHITYKEAVFSDTALRKGIDNTPSEAQLQNMQILAECVFEPLRAALGNRSIYISSFFRSLQLNHALSTKASKNSQHMANNGAAMDLDNDRIITGPTNREIFDYILNNLIFDQLILEFPDQNEHPSWVHVSYNIDNNRMQVLKSIRVNGKVKYIEY
jgi:hypothetical protein